MSGVINSNNANHEPEMAKTRSLYASLLTGAQDDAYPNAAEWLIGFHALDEITSEIFAVANCNSGEIIYTGQKFNKLMARQGDQESRFSNIFEHFVFQEDIKEFVNDVCINGKVIDKEIQMMKGNGEFFLASFSASIIHVQGQGAYIIAIKDIGQQKVIEEEKLRLLEELEISKEQIEEEAGKLVSLNAQLEFSEQKLQELNTSKDKLFSIIGHDLKNPFFVISSYADILNEEYDTLTDQEKREFIEVIRSTSNFAQKLLENLLHWARSQTGRIEYIPEPLSLQRIVDNSIQLLHSQAMKKNINLIYDVNESLAVLADKNMLDTILRNLMSNAIKFTEQDGIVAVLADDAGEYIHVRVKDTGIGMSESDLAKLFRIDVNNSEIGSSKEKGTGLGLILCKEFVEKHAGKIWVESIVGKGSTFNFTIPKCV